MVAEFATMKQIEEAHQRALGKPIAAIPTIFGWAITKLSKNTRDIMSRPLRRGVLRRKANTSCRIRGVEVNHHSRISGEYPTFEEEIEIARQAYNGKTYYQWISQRKK